MNNQFLNTLIEHEGLRLFPYKCTAGKLTIGVGHNLDGGITYEIAMAILNNDIQVRSTELRPFEWFSELDEVRRDVIVELDFNIGMSRLLKFKRMIAALKSKDYELAATEMLDSKWSGQVGENRSQDMAYRLRYGRYKPQ